MNKKNPVKCLNCHRYVAEEDTWFSLCDRCMSQNAKVPTNSQLSDKLDKSGKVIDLINVKKTRTISMWQGIVTNDKKPRFKGFVHSEPVVIDSDLAYGEFSYAVVKGAKDQAETNLNKSIKRLKTKVRNIKPFGHVGVISVSSGQGAGAKLHHAMARATVKGDKG